MSEQTFKLLRRINLGNYEHYELEITIHDVDENRAMERVLALYEHAANALDLSEKADIKEPEKFDIQPEPVKPPTKPRVTIPQIMDSLPDRISKDLDGRIEGDKILISTRQYMRGWKEEWSLVNNVVKECGGRWVSAGRDSRWEVPLK